MPSSKDINEKMKVVPELRSPHARYPLNRSRWIRPSEEPRTPKQDGDELTFIPHPKTPKGQTNQVKLGYVWGPGTKGFGYYHLLTKEAYVALSARLHSETAPTPTCCGAGGNGKRGNDELEDLRYVYQFVVHPRSKCPVPNDSSAYNHSVEEGRASHINPEDNQWSNIVNPIRQGKVKV